jgi:hypothetical protein
MPKDMGMLKIERLGGFAGFGGPNLKSEGQHAFADLSLADQQSVEKLFAGGAKPASHAADMFNYRITRQKKGRSQSIEVPENLVPAPLIASVKDMLR